jgi:hypothetical protein
MRESSYGEDYFFALRPRFLAVFFLAVFFAFFFFAAFFGTLLPAALASDNPIAIACLRLLTLRPDRPLFNVPALRFFIARPTLADAFLEYFRAMTTSRLRENNPRERRWFPCGVLVADGFGPRRRQAIAA